MFLPYQLVADTYSFPTHINPLIYFDMIYFYFFSYLIKFQQIQ